MQQRTSPSDFVKLGSEILYLFLAEKMVVSLFCLLVLFVCLLQYFVRFLLTVTFLIEALIELIKMLLRKKLFDVRFGNWPDSADLLVYNF